METTITKSLSPAWSKWVLLIIILGAFFLRFIALDADPPPSVGLHFTCDEGWWVHNARNQVLFGQWVMDEFNQSLLVSPTFCVAVAQAYSMFGVSLASSRIVPALSGFLALLFFIGILRRSNPGNTLIPAALLMGWGFGFVAMNRIAYVDSTAFCFLMLGWWLLESFHNRVWGVFLAGMAAALAFVTKSYTASVAPVFLLIWLSRVLTGLTRVKPGLSGKISRRGPLKKHVVDGLLFVAGIAAVMMFWYRIIYMPFQDQFQIMYHLWQDGNIPGSISEAARNLPSFIIRSKPGEIYPARFFNLNMVLILLAGWRVIQLLTPEFSSVRKAITAMPRMDREMLIWLVVTLCCIAPLTAKPFRRYLFLYPPLIILASRTLLPVTISAASRGYSRILAVIRTMIFAGIPTLLAGPGLISLIIYSGTQTAGPGKVHSVITVFLGLAAIFGIFAAAAFMTRLPRRRLPAIPLAAVLVLILLFEGIAHGNAWSHRSYSLSRTSQRLGATVFSEDTVVLGGLADTLCLETKAQALAIWGRQEAPRVLNENPVERFNPDYIIILKELDGIPWGFEERYYRYIFPENFVETLNLLPDGRGGFRVKADIYRAPETE